MIGTSIARFADSVKSGRKQLGSTFSSDQVCATMEVIHYRLSHMPLLIDGHNLIGRMPDIHLDDPDDEAKLVSRLRAYSARTRKRVTVVFDHGLPGGRSNELSGGGVAVIFASTGRQADGIIRERTRRARDPRGLTVVTSDQDIIRTAQARGARVMRSGDFAAQLDIGRSARVDEDVHLSKDEVEDWLKLFAGRPDG